MQRIVPVLTAVTLTLAGCGGGITEPIVPDAVRLAAIADTLAWGETTTLTATYLVGGATLPSDGGLRWSTAQPQYFSIDSLTGRGQAFETFDLGPHPVQVIAQSHGVADTTTVIIVPSLYALRMTLSSAVALGRTFRPAIQALDGVMQRDFTPPPEAGAPVLRSSNPAVVSVEPDGRLTARGAGLAWVVATLQGVSDSTQVRVGTGYPISLVPASGGLTPIGVNDAGQAIALLEFGSTRSSLFFDGDTRIDLACFPRAINDAGAIACGDGRVYSGGTLGPFPSGAAIAAADITDAGAVFGMRKVVQQPSGAETFEPVVLNGASLTPLAASTCCGPLGSVAAANELGHVVGASRNAPDGGALLLRGSEGRVLDLPRVEWATPGFRPVASAINDGDDVVGSGPKMRALGTAAVWLAAEQWTGRFLGLRTQTATGISEGGLVVGEGLDGSFVWRADRYALLQDLVAEDGWAIAGAVISRGGLILARGSHTSGKSGLVRITTREFP
jgi:hypothetical protein